MENKKGYISFLISKKKITFFRIHTGDSQYILKPVNIKLTVGGFISFKVEKKGEDLLVSEILYYSKPLKPIPLLPGSKYKEKLKLTYPYLFARADRDFLNILRLKSDFLQKTRKFFIDQEFVEIETPLLGLPSVESTGAKVFLVNSIKGDKFFGLPQSPQYYKQIAIYSGIPKYFQIAKSFRAEDLREDRQYEFLQIDIEQVLDDFSIEPLLEHIKNFIEYIFRIFSPSKNLLFKRISFCEALKEYGHENIDLRFPCFYSNEEIKIMKKNFLFSGIKTHFNSSFEETENYIWIKRVSPKNFKTTLNRIYQLLKEENSSSEISYVELVFPKTLKKGTLDNSPFNKNVERHCLSFDIVLNGVEVASGAVRENSPDGFIRNLQLLQGQNESKEFETFIEALSFGTPIHGGYGVGFDRLFSILVKDSSDIKGCRLFNMTKSGTSLLEGIPLGLKK